MAGRERGGAISARADIFVGRPWVVCRDEETPASDLALVEGSRSTSARPRSR
jgi:prephenate dehydrogenase